MEDNNNILPILSGDAASSAGGSGTGASGSVGGVGAGSAGGAGSATECKWPKLKDYNRHTCRCYGCIESICILLHCLVVWCC